MARLIIYTIAVLLFGTISLIVQKSAWFAVTSGIALGFLVPLVDALLVNARWHRIGYYSISHWNKRVRISISYLYRINIDGRYLLVKGSRFDQYQPVGGVYKTHRSFDAIRQQFNVLTDQLLTPDPVSENDLRVRIRGRNLYGFVQWFESGHNREADCLREFREELLQTAILPAISFQNVKYDFITRRYHKLRYSQWAASQELLIADIVELIPTAEQTTALRLLNNGTDERYIWADEDQIRRLGAVGGATSQPIRIAETARWTIDTHE